MSDYQSFLDSKAQLGADSGFDPLWMPDFLSTKGGGFQAALTDWAIRKGRAAIFADCGLGKSPMSLVWAENVVRHTNRPVLIATPLAVSYQLLREAEKFGVEAVRSIDGTVKAGARIVVTNYERMEHFDSGDFAGAVCDESSILKNFSGQRKAIVTEFLRTLPYRLLCTATAAPNDYMELGTSSEALGDLEHLQMLARFFTHDSGDTGKWRLKGHARTLHFWRWVCSWARAVREPADLGFDNQDFVLPPLEETTHIVAPRTISDGTLFQMAAVGLHEQRKERRRTIAERCEKVAALVAGNGGKSIAWCHLNAEGDLLEELIPDAVQVAGSDSDDAKEEALLAFAEGDLPCLVTKPTIAGWGLNLHRCAHVTTFPSHSFEQQYQMVRRCWRFGQKKTVTVDIVATEGEADVLTNMRRKADQAALMFEMMVAHMHDAQGIAAVTEATREEKIPSWL